MAATSYYGDREAGAQGSSQPAKGIVSGLSDLEANHVTVISWQGPERFLNLCHDSHAQKSLSLTPQL